MKKALLASLILSIIAAVPIFAVDYSSQDTIKQVQEALNSAGYNCGTPDGIIGSGTRGQIEKYRADNGLTAGNAIDDELYNSLFDINEPEPTPAVEEEPISLHLDSEYGIIDLVRYELNGNDLFLVFDYQNTTDETTMPLFKYNTTVFQNGKEINTGFSMNKPSDCDYGSVKIRPGASLRYCVVYNLTELSPVELEVYALYDFSRNIKETVTINFDSTIVESSITPTASTSEASTEIASTAANEDLEKQLSEAKDKIATLEKQLEDANSKISELQGQLDAIKAAIGN